MASSPGISSDSGVEGGGGGDETVVGNILVAQKSTKHGLNSPFSDFDCSDPLGMESGEITSDQIMVSSQYNPSWSPERSRLNYYENAWTPAEDSNKEWIQVTHGIDRK